MTVIQGPDAQSPDSTAERVLLVNPPVYDTRLHWAQWQQPTYLLRLATFLLDRRTDVRLIDTLFSESSSRMPRKRVGMIDVDGETVPKWRFGMEESAIRRQLTAWEDAGWSPDDVYIEGFTTVWWEGAAEAAKVVKEIFPRCRVIMVGGYPTYAPQHTRECGGADVAVTEFWPEVAALSADVSLYTKQPGFLYISTNQGLRSASEIVGEIKNHVARGIKRFAFVDHDIARQHTVLFRSILEHLAAQPVDAKFTVIGNIAPADLVEHSDLAALMRRVGYTQIYFADDRTAPVNKTAGERLVDEYRIAAETCHGAGFRERTGDICASISVGRPQETIEERARVATRVSHYAGSVILWPYQPSPHQCPGVPLEGANGKLFPFRHQNGYNYRDYLNLLGLGVVLNSKYRDQTFDFLGDGLVARMLRDSIAREGWNPDPAVKGSLRVLPVQRN